MICGRQLGGPVRDQFMKPKDVQRLNIRNKQATEHKHISNDLHDYLLSKDTTAFWKTWKSKFKSKRKASVTVDGFTEPNKIANDFATNFKNACSPNNETHNQDLKNKFLARFSQYHPACKFSTVSVEGVDQCIRKMKRGKAPGLDRIEAEHLVHAHPRLCVLLSLLFNQMLLHDNVPAKFGLGVIIPVEKGAALENSKSDNYRGITLSSNLSKLFEMCMLELYGTYLLTSDLQFGFKKGLGCSHALLAARSVVDYFTNHGSNVNLCALDMSKAFIKLITMHCSTS